MPYSLNFNYMSPFSYFFSLKNTFFLFKKKNTTGILKFCRKIIHVLIIWLCGTGSLAGHVCRKRISRTIYQTNKSFLSGSLTWDIFVWAYNSIFFFFFKLVTILVLNNNVVINISEINLFIVLKLSAVNHLVFLFFFLFFFFFSFFYFLFLLE